MEDDVWARHIRRMDRAAKQESIALRASLAFTAGSAFLSAALMAAIYAGGLPAVGIVLVAF